MQQQELEQLLDLFLHPGWKIYQEYYGELLKYAKEDLPFVALNDEQLREQRGKIQQLEGMLGFENFIRATMEQEGQEDADV